MTITLSRDDLRDTIREVVVETIRPLIIETVQPMITAAIAPLVARIDTLTERVDTLTTEVHLLSDRLESVEMRLVHLESRFEELEDRVERGFRQVRNDIVVLYDEAKAQRILLRQHERRLKALEQSAPVSELALAEAEESEPRDILPAGDPQLAFWRELQAQRDALDTHEQRLIALEQRIEALRRGDTPEQPHSA